MEVTAASQALIQSAIFAFVAIFITGFLGAIFITLIERWLR